MKLIVGLGNPGRRYEHTPHNVGFEVVDELAKRAHAGWRIATRFEAALAELEIAAEPVVLMKPLTYMNLSGNAVRAYIAKNGGTPEDTIVISDDVHLDLGRIRIRPNGSDGGHNGLKSMIQGLESRDFPRLRIGVRPIGVDIDDRVEFVLGRLAPSERKALAEAVIEAADAIEAIIAKGLHNAMSQYNRKRAAPE